MLHIFSASYIVPCLEKRLEVNLEKEAAWKGNGLPYLCANAIVTELGTKDSNVLAPSVMWRDTDVGT